MQTAQTTAQRIAQINQTLDTLDENMFTMLRDVADYAEMHSWIDPLVESGIRQINVMKRRIAELQNERRQLRQQPAARAS